ncbi:hypothetical protein GVN24_29605 [Rhizobium sp. CRIBSB]|nr:hypothetical protein [Rhizobium sp. CRIBSB]
MLRFASYLTLVTAMGLGLAGSPAMAQRARDHADLTVSTDGTTYYNLPGATWSEHDTAVRDCGTQAGNAIYGYASTQELRPMDSLLTRRPTFQGFVENCMVLKGWRVIQMDPWKVGDMGRLDRTVLAGRLAPLVGAPSPEGVVARVFSNEAARADTVFNRYLISPSPPRTLSIRATRLDDLPSFWSGPPASPGPGPESYIPYIEGLTTVDLERVPSEAAIVIFRLRGIGKEPTATFGLARMVDPELRAERRTTAVEPSNFIFVGPTPAIQRRPAAERGDVVLAYPVVPGRYRIEDRLMMSFCFGAPAFEIGAGEVVYMGDFDIGGQAILSPEMSLAPAQAMLASHPNLLERLRPAQWVNGTTGVCRDWAYALEFPGFPFEEGYVRGTIPRPVVNSEPHVSR